MYTANDSMLLRVIQAAFENAEEFLLLDPHISHGRLTPRTVVSVQHVQPTSACLSKCSGSGSSGWGVLVDQLQVSTLQELAAERTSVLCGISSCQTKAQVGLLPQQIRLQVSVYVSQNLIKNIISGRPSLLTLLLSEFQPRDAGTPFA